MKPSSLPPLLLLSRWTRAVASVALAAAALMSLTGCSAAPSATVATPAKFIRERNPALVLPPSDDGLAMSDEFNSWESSRRDNQMGSMNGPIVGVVNATVSQQYENLSVSNGTPRNDSWTYSRSIQVRTCP